MGGGAGGVKLTDMGDAQVSGGPRVGQGVFCVLRRRRDTPGWADDPVRKQVGC